MSASIIGLIVSASSVVLLSLLFRMERVHGFRVGGAARIHLDTGVERTGHALHRFGRYIGRDLLRQSLHYFFHTILSAVLAFLRTCELRIQNMLRSNRVLARRTTRVRTTRNKLDEIADHKAAVALSPSEKQKRKEKILEGKI